MAPVAQESEYTNFVPLAYFSTAAAGSISLLAFISFTIRRLPASLTPSSSTRQQEVQRRRHVFLFALLAILSFSLVLYYTVARYLLSYEFWVNHHGSRQDIPNTLPGASYVPANSDESLQLGPWFASQSVPLQFYEVIAEKSRRFWWGQQFFAGLIAWSTFVGVEGYRRQFPVATKLAFLVVAQFLSLSVAQNLFYIALLLKPIPLASQNALHTPSQSLYIPFTLLGFFFLADLPLRYGDALFNGSLFGALIAVPTLLGTLPDITPARFLTTHKNVHFAHRSYTTIFTAVSVFALATHVWFSSSAILDNTPDLHPQHRSIFTWPLHFRVSEPETSSLKRAEVAISRVLGALGDHPAVNAVGWDVLLSLISLGIWCIVRGVDTDGIIECGVWPWHKSSKHISGEDNTSKRVAFHGTTKQEDGNAVQRSPAKKGRGRSKKTEDNTSSIIDATPEPIRKASEAVSGSLGRRRTRRKETQTQEEDNVEDEEYIPSRTTAAALANFEHEEEPGEAGGEAGALAWGLWAIGGLGVATASALGSEVIEA